MGKSALIPAPVSQKLSGPHFPFTPASWPCAPGCTPSPHCTHSTWHLRPKGLLTPHSPSHTHIFPSHLAVGHVRQDAQLQLAVVSDDERVVLRAVSGERLAHLGRRSIKAGGRRGCNRMARQHHIPKNWHCKHTIVHPPTLSTPCSGPSPVRAGSASLVSSLIACLSLC